MPFGPLVSVDPVDADDADDLAEGQRHDRQIVAAQPQHGEAQHDAPERGEDAGHRQADPEDRPKCAPAARRNRRRRRRRRRSRGRAARPGRPRCSAPSRASRRSAPACRGRARSADAGDEGQQPAPRPATRGDQLAGAVQPIRPTAGRGCTALASAGARQRSDQQPPDEDDAAPRSPRRPALPRGPGRVAAVQPTIGPQRRPARTKSTEARPAAATALAQQPASPVSMPECATLVALIPSPRPRGRECPVGRKISAITRMENAATSLYCDAEIGRPESLDQADQQPAQHRARAATRCRPAPPR